MDIEAAFAKVKFSFPSVAMFQGVHFKYAVKNGGVLLETRHSGRFFQWLLVGETFKLIHASQNSKLEPRHTVAESLQPSQHVL